MIEKILIVALGIIAIGSTIWAHLQKRRADKVEHKASEGKVELIETKAKLEVEKSDLDDLVADANERYPGSGSNSETQ